jgi:hypothetical protein
VGRVVKPSAGFIALVRLVVQASLALRALFSLLLCNFSTSRATKHVLRLAMGKRTCTTPVSSIMLVNTVRVR